MNTKTKKLQSLDKKFVWHPFTQMEDWLKSDNLVIEKGDGIYLYDTDGNKYIDGVSSLWVNVYGHRKKEIDKAISDQLKKISHSTLLGLANVPSILLAKELIKVAPKRLKKVFYSDNGATSVEIALKMAYQYWQHKGLKNKTKFIALKESYHGDTIGSVSVGGIKLFHNIFKPLLFDAYFAYENIEKIIEDHHNEVAAVIMEPLVQGAGGIIVQPKGFLKKVRNLCTKYKVLLIADEVAVGFGRTGKMFACDHEHISPDLMCVAKGLTGGYLPVAATLATNEIFKAFLGTGKTFYHGHTYTGNPLGCAAALATLKLFKKEKLLKKLQPKIKLLAKELEKFKTNGEVKEIRQCGLIAGIELNQKASEACLLARKYGLIIRPLGNVIVIMPPFAISNLQLKKMLQIIYKVILP